MVVCLGDDALSGPLPELCLGSPELFAIATNHQRGAFLPFPLLFFWSHLFSFRLPLIHFRHGIILFRFARNHAITPKGNLSREAAIQLLRGLRSSANAISSYLQCGTSQRSHRTSDHILVVS